MAAPLRPRGARGLPASLPRNDPRLRRIPRHRTPPLSARRSSTRRFDLAVTALAVAGGLPGDEPCPTGAPIPARQPRFMIPVFLAKHFRQTYRDHETPD